ncbi:MAG TPA: hypothetical protein VJ579_03315 [Candidatus Paceibacterota bacterium]|nr:hypothetical protein [Candidatus Paceibacterota bacterium]
MLFPPRLFEDADKPNTSAYRFWERAAEVAFTVIVVGVMFMLD